MRIIKPISALALIGGVAVIQLGGPPAQAQDYSSMSCDQLWYARNSIYSDAGYCFKTARGIAAFGRGCFPPYGQLSGGAQARVGAIQTWEGRRGC
jgi:hypothetical protein